MARTIRCASLVLVLLACLSRRDLSSAEDSAPLTHAKILQSREDVRAMFTHAYDNYMELAFPHDELKPVSGGWTDSWAELGNLAMQGLPANYSGVAMTLVESMSTLAVMGNTTEFSYAVRWCAANLSFDLDIRVNVFESNIRLVGGLISAHMLASDPALGLMDDTGPVYSGELLALAVDLAERLLPAFETPTEIPYAWVNLRRGVLKGETTEQNTAGGGTFILEFGMLSSLTQDWRFGRAALAALRGLWSLRSGLNLLGNTVDVRTGKWIHGHAGVGAGSDSFYEYLLKCYVLFDHLDCRSMFLASYEAIQVYAFKDPWYIEASMKSGDTLYAEAQGLQAFWPGLQVLHGDLAKANRTHRAFHSLWRKYGVLPERHSLVSNTLHRSEKYYLLRPEHAESTMHLFQSTKEPYYQRVGREIAQGLRKRTKTPFGFASVHDVSTWELEDRMCSFFMSEHLKYLFLLFDPTNFAHSLEWSFTTEGHLFKLPLSNATHIRELWRLHLPAKLPAHKRPRVCRNPAVRRVKGAKASKKKSGLKPTNPAIGSKLGGWFAVMQQLRSCHVPDKRSSGQCASGKDCGVTSEGCTQRKCSVHGWCYH